MWRKWMRWLVGLVCLVGALAALSAWGLDRLELNRRRHLLGTMQYACRLYARDHSDAMPPNLDRLFPHYLTAPSWLTYGTNDVDYFPGATETSNPNTVLLREKRSDRHGRRWVAYIDMSLDIERHTPSDPP